MFVIGEAKSMVFNGKVAMPKEYHLKKRVIMGKWKNDSTLYISDSKSALNYIAGSAGDIFMVNIDTEDKIQVPGDYDKKEVMIQGCISTIELIFQKI